jgi:aldose 1-epimerase
VAAPSGEQYLLVLEDRQAVVTGVGASLRRFSAGGHELLAGYGEQELASAGRGQVLAPWPNRLGDGRYSWRGVAGRAALDEPERSNAIHGLVRWLAWQVVEQSATAVSLRCPLAPQPAYPFGLDLSVSYSLDAGGLTVTTTAACSGDSPAPFGIGFHPYLSAGTASVDSATLRLPAGRRLLLDERCLPVGEEEVEGTPHDFRRARPVGELQMDDCFTGLEAGEGEPAGRCSATLRDEATGLGVSLWVDAEFGYLMCYTGDTLPEQGARRKAVAIEPMTCPPNALASGRGVIPLEPGERFEASWGLRPDLPGGGG